MTLTRCDYRLLDQPDNKVIFFLDQKVDSTVLAGFQFGRLWFEQIFCIKNAKHPRTFMIIIVTCQKRKKNNLNKKQTNKQTNTCSNIFEGNDEENCISIVSLLALIVTCMFWS